MPCQVCYHSTMLKRLESLDALRGFDMLMITGLSGVLVKFLMMLGVGKDSALILASLAVSWSFLLFLYRHKVFLKV